jgi:hypothetical protein
VWPGSDGKGVNSTSCGGQASARPLPGFFVKSSSNLLHSSHLIVENSELNTICRAAYRAEFVETVYNLTDFSVKV